jgi:hypothetical protein
MVSKDQFRLANIAESDDMSATNQSLNILKLNLKFFKSLK